MLTRIRNAQMRKRASVVDAGLALRARVLDVLKPRATSAATAEVEYDNGKSEFEIELKYFDGQPVIREIERVSQARPPRLCVGEEHPARSPTASACRSCRRRRA